MRITKEGKELNEPMAPLFGGYLIVEKDGRELHVVSVPSPNLYAQRRSDSVSENDDTFEDDKRNAFTMNVWSSREGVDWQLAIETAENGDNLLQRISVEYRANAF